MRRIEAVDGLLQLSSLQVDDAQGAVVFGGKEESVTSGIDGQVIDIAGEALVGMSEEDEIEVPTPQGTRVYQIVKVR